jgi:PiT family inorganic phosphate transporter
LLFDQRVWKKNNMDTVLLLAIVSVIVILLFDITNGFHDASNIIATVIASRAMTPIQAVIVVGTFEFIGPILGGTAVANTIGNFVDVSSLEVVSSMAIILCGISGAIFWNLLTWWFGIPSSSSHALVGGLVGAVVISSGPEYVVWGFGQLLEGEVTGVTKVILALIISPLIGFWAGFVIQRLMGFLLQGAKPSLNRRLRQLQWFSAAGLAFSHGANDGQKSMGIITMVLVLGGYINEFIVPLWVVLSCATMITIGILLGGWRIVRTVGFGIYKVRPLHAVDAQITSAAVIFGASMIGAPVSTTHVVSSSIMGIGASERPKAVRWGKAQEIVSTWLITIPGAALAAAVVCGLVHVITGAG